MLGLLLSLLSRLFSPMGLAAALVGLASLGIIFYEALRPARFWPFLVFFAVGTGGIVIASVGLLDEYLVGLVLLGVFAAAAVGRVRLRGISGSAWEKLHLVIFLAMASYMMFQAFRGMIEMETLRNIRWILYYGLIGMVAVILSTKTFPVPSKRDLSILIAKTSIVYFVLYMAAGFSYTLFTGGEKWGIQNVFWGGTTYAAFPLLIVMPALLFLIKDTVKNSRRIAWIALTATVLAAFYYESRASWLVIIGFFITAFSMLGFKTSLRYVFIFLFVLLVFVGYVWPSYYTFNAFGKVLFESSELFWKPSGAHDVGRLTHIRIALPAISRNPQTFLFGYGLRTSGQHVGQNLAAMYLRTGYPDLAVKFMNYQSTIGFTSLLIETGVIGFLLLVANFFFIAKRILLQRYIQGRFVLLFSLASSFLWLFITNPTDIILFYFMIMPSGILVQLSRNEHIA